MEGMNPNFPGGNASNMLQQMNSYNNLQNLPNVPVPQQQQQQQQQQPNLTNNNNNIITPELNPKRQAVFDRLKKRMGGYRKRQNDSIPRFDQTFSGICEQQSMETNVLQKRFVESKAKRVAKKADKKATDVTPSNVTVTQTKQIKRPAMDDLENDGEILPPAAKIPATGNNTAIDNMKFQVEIVQQLEFTTSVANAQPHQISTNVTVKAMTNGSVKYESQEMKPQKLEPIKMQGMTPLPPPPPDILHDFKQEPDNEFADLDFGGLANFMANDESELKKLFSNISEVFDQDLFDQDKIKQEPRPPQNIPQMTQQNVNQMNQLNQQFNHYVMPESCHMQKPMMQQQVQQQQQQHQRMYQSQQVPQQQIPDMTHAAQALKNMAQQHQVKNSMNYMRPVAQPMVPQMNQQQPQPNMTQRMPYQQQPQQQFNEYSGQFLKNTIQMPFPPEMIKQEMMMQQQQPQMAPMMNQMKPMMNHQMMVHQNEDMKMNQQYQQYQNTQFVGNHQPQPQQQRNFQGQNTMNIHMKQTQMMHIQQPNGTGNIQMQGGQHMHFAGEMKMGEGANFTMQQQQNMYFNNHHTHQPNTHPQYGNMQAMQKRPQHHQPMGGVGEGPNNTYNMMQSQSMSFTQ